MMSNRSCRIYLLWTAHLTGLAFAGNCTFNQCLSNAYECGYGPLYCGWGCRSGPCYSPTKEGGVLNKTACAAVTAGAAGAAGAATPAAPEPSPGKPATGWSTSGMEARADSCPCPAGQCQSQFGSCGNFLMLVASDCDSALLGSKAEFCGDGCQCGACWRAPKANYTAPMFPIIGVPGTGTGNEKKCVIREDFNGKQLSSAFQIDYCPEHVTIGNGNAQLVMNRACGTRISSVSGFYGGYVEARIQSSDANGVVTAFITRSDPSRPADEVDWEVVGLTPDVAQSNYFHDSIPDYSNSIGYQDGVSGDLSQAFHVYGIEFNSQSIRWWFDGVPQRTIDSFTPNFPSKPMRVELSIWDGSQTSGWAGQVDFNQAPFNITVDYIHIQYFC